MPKASKASASESVEVEGYEGHMENFVAFLADLVAYTPTASWLNQVELFFSILERRLLKHGEFDSVDNLADRIIAFINDYNRRAAPFRWTYNGRPLMAA